MGRKWFWVRWVSYKVGGLQRTPKVPNQLCIPVFLSHVFPPLNLGWFLDLLVTCGSDTSVNSEATAQGASTHVS